MMVESGEIFGILGPNGSGKTTTLNMITAALPPDKEKVVIQTFLTFKETPAKPLLSKFELILD